MGRKTPYDSLTGSNYGSPERGFIPIGQPGDTTPSTRGIGQFSVDLTGNRPIDTTQQKAEGLGAVPGALFDIATGAIGAAAGGVFKVAQIPYDLGAGFFKDANVQRYIDENVLGKPAEDPRALTINNVRDQIAGVLTAIDSDNKKFRENITPVLANAATSANLFPMPLGGGVAANPALKDVLGVLGAGAKTVYQEAEEGPLPAPAALAAAGLAGAGAAAYAYYQPGGNKLAAVLAPRALGLMLDTSPDQLPSEAKLMLENGATAEETRNYMADKFAWVGDDLMENLMVGIALDPIGSAWKYSGGIVRGLGKASTVSESTGMTFFQAVAEGGMSQTQKAIARRTGLLGPVIGKVGKPVDRLLSMPGDFFRAKYVQALQMEVGIEKFGEVDDLARSIGGDAPVRLARATNTAMAYESVNAMTAVRGADNRNAADLFIKQLLITAQKGKEAIKVEFPELRGADDAFLDGIVAKSQAYFEVRDDQAKEIIDKLANDLIDKRTEFLFNQEVNFGLVGSKDLSRLVKIGLIGKRQSLEAGRRAIRRSLAQSEIQIQRALEVGGEYETALFTKMSGTLKTVLNTANNGGSSKVDEYVRNLIESAKSKWKKGGADNQSDAVRGLSRYVEVSRLLGFSKAASIILEAGSKNELIQGMRLTPVRADRFSKEGLANAIQLLRAARESGDANTVIATVSELVRTNRDLARIFDSMLFADNLKRDPMNVAASVARHLQSMYESQVYVSRINQKINAVLDAMAIGQKEADEAGAALQRTVETSPKVINTLYEASKLSDTSAYFSTKDAVTNSKIHNDITDVMLVRMQDMGISPENMHNFVVRRPANTAADIDSLAQAAADGEYDNAEFLKKLYNFLTRSDEIITDESIPAMYDFVESRKLTELIHNGYRALNDQPMANQIPLAKNTDLAGKFTKMIEPPDGISVIEKIAPEMSPEFRAGKRGQVIISERPLATQEVINRITKPSLGGIVDNNPAATFRASGDVIYYVPNVSSEFINKIAARELAYNQLAQQVIMDPSLGSIYNIPKIKIGKKNYETYFDRQIKMQSVPMGENPTRTYLTQRIDTTEFGSLNDAVTNDEVTDVVIFGGTKEGIAEFQALLPDSKVKIILDPARIALSYAFEDSPTRLVPSLDHLIIHKTKDGRVAMVNEIARPNGYGHDKLDTILKGKKSLEKFVEEYLDTKISKAGNTDGLLQVVDLLPDEVKVIIPTGSGTSKVDIKATAQNILELDPTGSGMTLRGRISMALRNLDQARASHIPNGAAGEVTAWEKSSSFDELDRLRFSYSDILHNMDGAHDRWNTPETLMKWEDYGGIDGEIRPLSFLRDPLGISKKFDYYLNDPDLKTIFVNAINDAANAIGADIIGPGSVRQGLAQVMKLAPDFPMKEDVWNLITGRLTYTHYMLEQVGALMDSRIAVGLGKLDPADELTDGIAQAINPPDLTFQRVYSPSGSLLLEKRWTNPAASANGAVLSAENKLGAAELNQSIPFDQARKVQNVARGFPATPEAPVSTGVSVERSVEEALDANDPQGKVLADQESMMQLAAVRDSVRALGYDLGIEPRQRFHKVFLPMRDLDGKMVTRPTLDFYTSIQDQLDPDSLKAIGINDMDLLPERSKGLLGMWKSLNVPISNSELYDNTVERLRVYLGSRISEQEAASVMSRLLEKTVRSQLGGFAGLSGGRDGEIAATFQEVLGSARRYEEVFGQNDPRAAILFAVENDANLIGYTTKLSKNLQRRNQFLADLAQRIYPLIRYRYNPYFNTQEAIEPYAFTLLRGIRGEAERERATISSSLYGRAGTGAYERWETGAQVIRANASLPQALAKETPELENGWHMRTLKTIQKKNPSLFGRITGLSEAGREAIGESKYAAYEVTSHDELYRDAGQRFFYELPEVQKAAFSAARTADPTQAMSYLHDAQVKGMLPQQILRDGEVASAPHAFGAIPEFENIDELDALFANAENLSVEKIESMQDVASQLDEVGAGEDLAEGLSKAIREMLTSLRKQQSSVESVDLSGSAFAGKKGMTTGVGIQKASSAVSSWQQNEYNRISSYLGDYNPDNVPGIQATRPTRRVPDLYQAETIERLNKQINTLDELIASNRIINNGPLFRSANLLRLTDVLPKDIEPGFEFGTLAFTSWSKTRAGAESIASSSDVILKVESGYGINGIDINAYFPNPSFAKEDEVLLPRNLRFKVISNNMQGSRRVLTVTVTNVAPKFVELGEQIVASGPAFQKVRNAIGDYRVRQYQLAKQQAGWRALLQYRPDLLDEAQRLGANIPGVVSGFRAKRQAMKQNPISIPKIEPGNGAIVDPMRMTPQVSLPTAQPSLPSDLVFGTRIGEPGGFNTGGKSGVWIGTDGVERHVKTMAPEAKASGERSWLGHTLNEFIAFGMYRKMGVPSAAASLVRDGDDVYLVKEMIGVRSPGGRRLTYRDAPITEEMNRQFADNAVADTIIAAQDVLGLDRGNVVVDSAGVLWRIDAGNSFMYRAGKPTESPLKDPTLYENVDLGYFFGKKKLKEPADNYRSALVSAYGPNLQSIADIPTFGAQFREMIQMLGGLGGARTAIADLATSVEPVVVGSGLMTKAEFDAQVLLTQRVIEGRISAMSVVADQIAKVEADKATRVIREVESTGEQLRAAKIALKDVDPKVVQITNALSSMQVHGMRVPLIDEVMAQVMKGEKPSDEALDAIKQYLGPVLYKRAAIATMLDGFRYAYAQAAEIAFKEQYFATSKGILERTFNHPFAGPYPTSYMFNKVLPAFANALFKYAPFQGEFAPLVGARRLDMFSDYIAASLEQNEDLQDYVLSRPPLLLFINGLLPGWPTDIGVSLPYWFRDGVLRPIAEGKFETIPGRLAASVPETLGRTFGPMQSVKAGLNAVDDIQQFLLGTDKSFLGEVANFLGSPEIPSPE
jgi:hypothetical protein